MSSGEFLGTEKRCPDGGHKYFPPEKNPTVKSTLEKKSRKNPPEKTTYKNFSMEKSPLPQSCMLKSQFFCLNNI